jgi:hypothetical protein
LRGRIELHAEKYAWPLLNHDRIEYRPLRRRYQTLVEAEGLLVRHRGGGVCNQKGTRGGRECAEECAVRGGD